MRLIRKLDDIGCDRDTWERGRLRIHLSPGGDSPLRRLPSCSPQPQRDRIILFALEELVGCPVSQLNLGVELGLVIVVVGKGAVDLSEAQMWVLSLDLLGVPLIRDAAQITISKLPWPAFIRAGPGGLGKSAGTVLWQARQSLGNLMTNTGSQCLRSASRCRCTKSAIFGYTKLWCPVLAGFGVFWRVFWHSCRPCQAKGHSIADLQLPIADRNRGSATLLSFGNRKSAIANPPHTVIPASASDWAWAFMASHCSAVIMASRAWEPL
jgi:hypothetical protein